MSSAAEAVLLDTHAAIWFAEGLLDPTARDRVIGAGSGGGIFVSPVSAWEIGLLARPRADGAPGLTFLPDPALWFTLLMTKPGLREAALTPSIAIASSFLPEWPHRDPADRLLVATAREIGCPLVTRDRTILAYAAAGHVAAMPC